MLALSDCTTCKRAYFQVLNTYTLQKVIVRIDYTIILSCGLEHRLERVWDPILVPGASKQISYFFLKAVRSNDL